mgnify:CR=1 FL=1
MLVVVPVTLTGYATFNEWGSEVWGGVLGDALGELHEATGEAFLWLVLAHLGGLLAISLWRRSNLTTPMLTGRIPGRGPDLVKHNHTWLAVLLALAVVVGMTPLKSNQQWEASMVAQVLADGLHTLKPLLPPSVAGYLS